MKSEKTRDRQYRLRIITVNVSDFQIDALESLADAGLYASRSEAIRAAINEFLERKAAYFEQVAEAGIDADIDLRRLIPKLRRGARIEWKL